MPYKLVKKTIYSKASGKWKKKQTCASVANAKKAMALLQGLESGSIKKEDVGKRKKFVKRAMKVKKWS